MRNEMIGAVVRRARGVLPASAQRSGRDLRVLCQDGVEEPQEERAEGRAVSARRSPLRPPSKNCRRSSFPFFWN